MSTFNGFIKEFPDIRIDYFRFLPGRPPPLACFLSHVHSDHLQGLESLRAPFIYCSSATRELLLRLERYPARLNFAKGLLETRLAQYKHLKNLLRPIPLNVPTLIELAPGRELYVTLLDANHCPGSVMFLIEGDGKAILYTGDVRAETWWVNSLARLPSIISFTTGLRRLDTIYLDTTFATKSNPYRRFPSKQEGIKELLEKVLRYPADTRFVVHSWTFGYEDVWIALASALKSRVHVDEYKLGLFRALATQRDGPNIEEAAILCGFKLGNAFHSGCLTDDDQVRLHACDRRTGCTVPLSRSTVRVIPIVNRLADGHEVFEPGSGGGYGDLSQEVEVNVGDPDTFARLMGLCQDIDDDITRHDAIRALTIYAQSPDCKIKLPHIDDADPDEVLTVERLPAIIAQVYRNRREEHESDSDKPQSTGQKALGGEQLPAEIRFPYSRHSSYHELRELVSLFRPGDLYPCTVDEANWHPELSMRHLFGQLCSEKIFAHDQDMLVKYRAKTSSQQTCTSTNYERATSTETSQHTDGHIVFHAADSGTAGQFRRRRNLDSDLDQLQDSCGVEQFKRLKGGDSQDKTNADQTGNGTFSSESDGVPPMASLTPQPYHAPERINESSVMPSSQDREQGDSQITLSDSAFGSQGSNDDPERSQRLKRRKEAYLAAKGRKGLDWKSFSTLQTLGRREDDELR